MSKIAKVISINEKLKGTEPGKLTEKKWNELIEQMALHEGKPTKIGEIWLKAALKLFCLYNQDLDESTVVISDGSNDYGIDGYHIDKKVEGEGEEENRQTIITIFQGKWSGSWKDIDEDFGKIFNYFTDEQARENANSTLKRLKNILADCKNKSEEIYLKIVVFMDDKKRSFNTRQRKCTYDAFDHRKNERQEVENIFEECECKVFTHDDLAMVAYDPANTSLMLPFVADQSYKIYDEEGNLIQAVGQIKLRVLAESIENFPHDLSFLNRFNVRNDLGNKNKTNQGLVKTLESDPASLKFAHNGLKFTGHDYNLKTGKLTGPSINNGQQSISRCLDVYRDNLGTEIVDNNYEETIPITINISKDTKKIKKITAGSNSQSGVRPYQFLALEEGIVNLSEFLNRTTVKSVKGLKDKKINLSIKEGANQNKKGCLNLNFLHFLQSLSSVLTGNAGHPNKSEEFGVDGEYTIQMRETLTSFDSKYAKDASRMACILLNEFRCGVVKKSKDESFKQGYARLFLVILSRIIMKEIHYKHKLRGPKAIEKFLKLYDADQFNIKKAAELTYVGFRRYLNDGYENSAGSTSPPREGFWRRDTKKGLELSQYNKGNPAGFCHQHLNGLYSDDYTSGAAFLWKSMRDLFISIQDVGIDETLVIIDNDPVKYKLFYDKYNFFNKGEEE